MALDHAALLEVLDTLKDGDAGERVRVAAETMYQALIDAELTATIGADRWERTQTRTNQRNGSRPRTFSTRTGDLQLRIPKLRTGSFFPSLLDRRRRVDQALFAVVMEAYLHGVSTRKVDDLVQALGVASGISKSEVSRICADLDDQVAAFRGRSLASTAYPYVFLDATYCKARVDHQVVSQAVVVAIGVRADVGRSVPAGASEAVFIGVDHGLYTVAAAEFGEHTGDVCLDSALPDVKAVGEFLVGQAGGDQAKHFLFSFGE